MVASDGVRDVDVWLWTVQVGSGGGGGGESSGTCVSEASSRATEVEDMCLGEVSAVFPVVE